MKYCTVVLQSGGCLPPFSVVAKRVTMLCKAELYLNMSTYPRKELVWIVGINICAMG